MAFPPEGCGVSLPPPLLAPGSEAWELLYTPYQPHIQARKLARDPQGGEGGGAPHDSEE